MKKVLALSAAALLMTGVYAAESNVQVYGVIDAAVTGYKVKGQDAVLEFTSGFSMGNRIGIRGREDLGNGYSVGFDLEQGLEQRRCSTEWCLQSSELFRCNGSVWQDCFRKNGFT